VGDYAGKGDLRSQISNLKLFFLPQGTRCSLQLAALRLVSF
jgi:hypothetical protein